jgi:ABC-type antimicrobial peptide transport system permease subunit
MVLLSVFAALALVLSCVGIYGVLAYLVGQRIQEIGIRVALGARPKDILLLIFEHGGKMVVTGVAIGIGLALVLTRLMTSMLYGIAANDPLTFAGVIVLIGLVAAAACALPARQAIRIDPILALRRQ